MMTFSTASLSETDYCALEDALLATEKGRRFLRTYVDRNRGLETLRLLRSISRMHRAALGVPGVNAEVFRDLTSVLKIVSKRREQASECPDTTARSQCLMAGLEEIEAGVITLIELIEERMAGELQDEVHRPSQWELSATAIHLSVRRSFSVNCPPTFPPSRADR